MTVKNDKLVTLLSMTHIILFLISSIIYIEENQDPSLQLPAPSVKQ